MHINPNEVGKPFPGMAPDAEDIAAALDGRDSDYSRYQQRRDAHRAGLPAPNIVTDQAIADALHGKK